MTLPSGSASAAPARERWLAAGMVFALALVLRLWGIGWGGPGRVDLNPDESIHVMSHALAVSLADPDPKFLNYPSLLIYMIAVANGVGTRLGWIAAPEQSYVLARTIVASFGAATAPAAFWLAGEMGASLLGAVLGGVWVALLPLDVWESHFAVTDPVMTFWIVVALALSVRLLRTPTLRLHALAGAAVGLAVASKYTAALAALAPLAATLLAGVDRGRLMRGVAVLGLAALAACFAGTPFTFLHFGQFRDAMAFEYAHVHGAHYGFSLPAPGWQYHKYVYELFAAFPFSMGVALYASAAAGTAWALWRPSRAVVVVLSFAVPFFAILGHWTFVPLRYQLPAVVIGAMLAGLWQGDWLESPSRPRRVAATLAVLVTLGYTTLFTLDTTRRFSDDTRIQAARWLDATMRPGERLLVLGYTPYLAIPGDSRIGSFALTEAWISHLDERADYDLVEVSSMHYWRHERHHHHAFEPAYRRFRDGATGFHLVRRFEDRFLNRDLYSRLDPMFAGYFVSPTLEFYARSR